MDGIAMLVCSTYGGAQMGNKLLLAVDQFEPGRAAVNFTIGLAARLKSDVQVLHVRELPTSLGIPPLESAGEVTVTRDPQATPPHRRTRPSGARPGQLAGQVSTPRTTAGEWRKNCSTSCS